MNIIKKDENTNLTQNKNTDNRIVNNSEAVAAIVEVCAKFGVNKFNISTKKDNDVKVRLGVQAGKVGNIGIDVEVNNNCEQDFNFEF